MWGARVESRAGGEEEAALAAAACGPASPRGRRAGGGASVRGAPAGGCRRTRGPAGAGAEFLQSLTWLPFRCCSGARQRGARRAVRRGGGAEWRLQAHDDHKIREARGVGARAPRASALRPLAPQDPRDRRTWGPGAPTPAPDPSSAKGHCPGQGVGAPGGRARGGVRGGRRAAAGARGLARGAGESPAPPGSGRARLSSPAAASVPDARGLGASRG